MMGSNTPSIDIAKVNQLIASAVDPTNNGGPGVVFQCVNSNGDILASAASGVRDIRSGQLMTEDTVFWIASCTKLVTSIAFMQLVERGQAELDDPDLVARVLPEVGLAKVFVNGEDKPQEHRITLRMLLTHTSGYAYTFLWEDWWNRIKQDGEKDEFQGSSAAFEQPLKFQPGTEREYSIGLDWIGVFIQRTTNLSLGQYCEENIFKPLGLQNTAMIPTDEMRSKLSSMHTRDGGGIVHPREHLNRVARVSSVSSDYFHAGGSGLFSTAADFSKILAALLNDGVSPTTLKQILKKSTLDQMCQNQIPDWQHKYAGRGHPICRTDLVVGAVRQDVPPAGKEGWGLSFLLMGENLQIATAAGISNCYWTFDREKGIAALLFSQILPLGDPAITPLWIELQKLVLG